MNTEVMFSSKSEEWETPEWLFITLNEEFNFDLDVAATAENTKCKNWFSKDYCDAFSFETWVNNGDVFWMNPPYGRGIGKWVKKAYEESLKGATVVCLLPSRTDTRWWFDYVARAKEIRFIKGRIKFGGASNSNNSAPFPSVIVVFSPYYGTQKIVWWDPKGDTDVQTTNGFDLSLGQETYED